MMMASKTRFIDLICSVYMVHFEQTSGYDDSVLSQLCKCFRLFSTENHRARGIHRGLIR